MKCLKSISGTEYLFCFGVPDQIKHLFNQPLITLHIGQWTYWWRLINTSSRRLKQVSNETPNDVSVIRHQDVSVVHIHDVPLVRLYDVSPVPNSQMKHPITSPWYGCTTSRNYVVAMPCLYYGFHYVFKLLCLDLHLVSFHVSFKYQIKHQIFLVRTRQETRGVVWVIN